MGSCVLIEKTTISKNKRESTVIVNIKEAIFELRSSHLFRDQSYKEILKVNCQACNFTGVLPFTSVFEDFGHIFPTCFCRTSHNLICNKKDTKIRNRKILKSGKTFYRRANIGNLYN